MSRARPVLLIDVDGVLNPYAARRTPEGFAEHRLAGFRVRLNPAHGAALRELAASFELVWATTWEEQANELIGPRLGLARLPVICFDFSATGGLKWPAIAAAIGDRPAVWLEDDPWPRELVAIRERRAQIPTLLLKPNPGIGLIPAHFVRAAAFGRAQLG
jgi:hypothetical protein